MGILSPVVEILRLPMLDRGQHLSAHHPVAVEFAGDDHPRHILHPFEWLAEELHGCFRVSAGLDQNVEYVAVLVDRTPQIMVPTMISMNTSSRCHLSSDLTPSLPLCSAR